jgi:hypothetical protein
MDNFDLKKYLAENKLNEEQDLDDEIIKLEKQLAILKNKKSTGGGTKLTPEQLQKVEKKLQTVWKKSDYDEIETVGAALDYTLVALLNNKWKGKTLTTNDLMNYSKEMAQSLGYKNINDLEKYTDRIANKVMGY